MTFDAADVSLVTQAFIDASLAGEPFDTELSNYLSAYDYTCSKDTPACRWWNADPHHPAIARSLKIDRNETAAAYALAPFRLGRVDEQPRILAALPCPHFFAPTDIDWLRIETVLAWDPRTDVAEVIEDAGPQLIGRLSPHATAATIYSSPFAFFRAIAEDRARFAVDRGLNTRTWARKPAESDHTPGLLLLGEPGKVQWPISTLPTELTCAGPDPRAVNRAILKQARVPHATAARERMAA
jgi:hypothetical protein